MSFYTFSPTGLLTIGFSKPFIRPPIINSGNTRERKLQLEQRYYDIGEVIKFDINSTDLDVDDLIYLGISGYILTDISEQSITVQIYFIQPQIISQNAVNPDTLTLSFNIGSIFIDSADFQRLEENLTISFPLVPQFTLEEFEVIEANAETACEVGKTFSLLTFGICLCLGYGLKHLWNTINVL